MDFSDTTTVKTLEDDKDEERLKKERYAYAVYVSNLLSRARRLVGKGKK